jgi:hypothetical protein
MHNLSLIVLFLCILSSCQEEPKELKFLDSTKEFWVDNTSNPSFLRAAGIWQIHNEQPFPHSIQIDCDRYDFYV